MENWKDIHKDFEDQWGIEWKLRGFNKKQTKEWIDIGLEPIQSSHAQQLRDMEQETPENISKLPDKDKYLKKQFQNYKIREVQSFPVEKLHNSYNIMQLAIEKWGGEKKLIYLIKTFPFEACYTTLQYLNRFTSLISGSLLLSKKLDAQTGGIITTISAGIDIILSFSKDKIFGIDGRAKLFNKLSEDVENIFNNYQEAADSLKPITHFSFSKELTEELRILKTTLNNFLENKDYVFARLDLLKGNSLRLIFLKTKQANSLLWEGLKRVTEMFGDVEKMQYSILIFKEAVSDYLQGISEEKINKQIKKRSLESKVVYSYSMIIAKNIKEVSLYKTIQILLKKKIGSFDKSIEEILDKETELAKEEIKRLIKNIFRKDEEKGIDTAVGLVFNEIDWNDEDTKRARENLSKALEELEKLGYFNKETAGIDVSEKDLENGQEKIKKDHQVIDLDEHFEDKEQTAQIIQPTYGTPGSSKK
ncbi:hypothetical protein [endosymbiont GvMRE of Glomus versiforme]|uniref:hypothetical protein n=1 Tax=endosymbiont GvMRE of Glomus versiforme TaxID=2039283 RepID=UPI000ED9D256|nr:hypothetical protein [endosymbiont GvMRE of Glomus versiforme]RHZ37400.1 hypothetical protein GvMRE_I1g609 [endosymbiont GvMRE of Glomus versiforme]